MFKAKKILKRIYRNLKCFYYAQGNYLTYLANRHGSDKGNMWPNKHNYTMHYHAYWQGLRKRSNLKILEVGLCRGLHEGWDQTDVPSIRMWLKYFPNAMIHGYDCSDFSFITHSRLRIYQGDQGSREDLEQFTKQHGGNFDIIIDDGSHASRDQQISLGVLFSHLKKGGHYVIEDIDWQPPELEKKDSIKTKDLLMSFQKEKCFKSQYLTDSENAYLSTRIKECRIFLGDKKHYADGEMSILTK